MPSQPNPKGDPDHIPVEKRLSGDFGTPLELMAARSLTAEQKRSILEVWLGDLEAQPDSPSTRDVRASIHEAMYSLERETRR